MAINETKCKYEELSWYNMDAAGEVECIYRDDKNRIVRAEWTCGYWVSLKYNEQGWVIYAESSKRTFKESEYDGHHNKIQDPFTTRSLVVYDATGLEVEKEYFGMDTTDESQTFKVMNPTPESILTSALETLTESIIDKLAGSDDTTDVKIASAMAALAELHLVVGVPHHPSIRGYWRKAMKTIGYQTVMISRFDYEERLKIKEYNEKGQIVYKEYFTGAWSRYTYNDKGLEIRIDCNEGAWFISEYNDQGQKTYTEDSNGNRTKTQYDDQGRCVEMENSSIPIHERYDYSDNKITTYRLDVAQDIWVVSGCMSL